MYLNQIKKNEKLRNWTMIGVITTLVTRGMAALLQSSVELVEWSSEVKVYSVRPIFSFFFGGLPTLSSIFSVIS